MYDKTIFIVGYGRTGSTLLKNIISTIPNCHISGENGNALYHLFSSVRTIENWQKTLKPTKLFLEDAAWANLDKINVTEYKKELWTIFVNKILLPKVDTKIVGFKEIRAFHDTANFNNYMNFLLSIDLNSKILFSTRNNEDVMKSGWWKTRPNKEKILIQYNEIINNYNSKNPENTYICHHNTYVNNFQETKKIFDFLSEKMDYDKIDKVIKKKKYS